MHIFCFRIIYIYFYLYIKFIIYVNVKKYYLCKCKYRLCLDVDSIQYNITLSREIAIIF